MPNGRLFFLMACLLAAIVLRPANLLAQQPPTKEFYQDFRGGKPMSVFLRHSGPNTDTVIKSEEEGLRITLPPEHLSKATVGLRTLFAVQGNFEITVGYEILHEDRPKDGFGMGFMLYVITESPTKEALGAFRLMRITDDVFQCSRRTTLPNDKRETKNDYFPATTKAGQLRMTRTGARVTVDAAEDGGKFEELRRYELGSEDLTRIELMAYPGRANKPDMPQKVVDIRIKELRIRAESFPSLPLTEVRDLPPPVDVPQKAGAKDQKEDAKTWPLVAALVGLGAVLFLAAVLITWLLIRNRRAAGDNEQPGAGEDAPFLSITCSACGKNLKVKAELAGKKLRCPHCGHIAPAS